MTLNPGSLNAQIRWLEKHIAIERNTCAQRVARKKMHSHTAAEIIDSLEGIRRSLLAARDMAVLATAPLQTDPLRAAQARQTQAERKQFIEHTGG